MATGAGGEDTRVEAMPQRLDVHTSAAPSLYSLEQRLRLRGRRIAIKHQAFSRQREKIDRLRRLCDSKISVAVPRVTRRVSGPCRQARDSYGLTSSTKNVRYVHRRG